MAVRVMLAEAASRCPHLHTRRSADDALELCVACGHIVRPLTHAGELELLRLAARYGVDELAHDGAADYGIRELARPKLKVVPKAPEKPAAMATRPAWEGVRIG